MIDIDCPHCGREVTIPNHLRHGGNVLCGICRTWFRLDYDETYDSESGEHFEWLIPAVDVDPIPGCPKRDVAPAVKP